MHIDNPITLNYVTAINCVLTASILNKNGKDMNCAQHVSFCLLVVQRHRDLPELLAERLTTHVKEIKQMVRSAVHIHYSSQVCLGVCIMMVR